MRIAIAQTNPVTGDLEGNVTQIVRDIRQARKDNVDIVAFPETAITGYCCGALFEVEDFVVGNKQLLEEIIAKEVPKDMVAVVGFVDIKGRRKDGYLDITNSVAVLQGGEILGVYDKTLLANSDHHEDKKYFTPGTVRGVFDIDLKGKKFMLGTPICEDAWAYDHERDIVEEMVEQGADLIICPNFSYFYYGKQAKRHNLFGDHARKKNVPMVSVNASGVGDIVKNIMIYDGGSIAYDAHGNLVAELNRFGPDFKVLDLDLQAPTENPITQKKMSKYDEIFDALVFEQRELFRTIGIKNAQVHMSGGIDSAVVGTIVREAMGQEHTIFITNPTVDNSDLTKSYAQYIADQLGVKLYWNSTQEPYEAVIDAHTKAFGTEPTLTGKACIQAVLRTVQGIGAYHTFKSGIVAAGNHTEIVEGWASFHDIGSIGVDAPIGDLTKIEVFQFAEYINNRFGREIIPHTLYDGTVKPAAELPDAKEDPIDYAVRSGIDAEIIRHRKSIDGLVGAYKTGTLTPEFFPRDKDGRTVYENYTLEQFTKQVTEAYNNARRSVFKSAQGAPVVIISPRSRGFSNRETIINHFPGLCRVDDIRKNIERGLKYGKL